MTDLVSIIIPTYNTLDHYLRDCLDSCINQTYRNLEILVIDDNSSRKETLELLKEYVLQDSRIKVVYRHENRGQAHNRNIGIDMCQGKYFTMIDHDDMLLPDFIEKSIEALKKNDVDFSMAHLLTFDDQSRYLPLKEQIELHQHKYSLTSGGDDWNLFGADGTIISLSMLTKMGWLFYLPVAVYGKVFDTQRYRDSGVRFDPGDLMRNVEDEDWMLKVALHMNNFVLLDFYGAMHRLSVTAASTASVKYFQQSLNAAVRRFDLLKEANILEPYYVSILKHALQCVAKICSMCENKEQRDLNWELIKEKLKRIDYPLEPRTGEYDPQYSYNLSQIYKYLYPQAPHAIFVGRQNLYDAQGSDLRILLEKWAYQGVNISALYCTFAATVHQCQPFNQRLIASKSEANQASAISQQLSQFFDNGIRHVVMKNSAFNKDMELNPEFDSSYDQLAVNLLHDMHKQKPSKVILVPQDDAWALGVVKAAHLDDIKVISITPDSQISEVFVELPQELAVLNLNA